MRVGFIGLGRMGSGMASNLIKSGNDVVVFDAYAPALANIVALGATAAESVADLAGRSDVIFTSLPGPAQVEEVALGEGGILEGVREGTAYFDLSTNSHALVLRLHKEFADVGVDFLDAPVSGGPAGAASGDLTIWAGGDEDVFRRHEPVLRAFSNPRLIGRMGAGTVTKLAHNLLGQLFFESMAEVFSLGTKAGVDPLDLWEAIRSGLVGRRLPLDALVPQFLPGDYDTPAMQLKLGKKDIDLALSLARDLDVPLRLSALVQAEITEAIGRGMGDQDSRAFMQLQVERAGVAIAVDRERLREAVDRNR